MKILVQFPTFGRPEKFLKCFKEYVALSSGKHNLHFNVNCEESDKSLPQYYSMVVEINTLLEEYKNIKWSLNVANFGNKISAINGCINLDFDIVICASDDMTPQTKGWDEDICAAMQENFPDLDGCVFFNDGHNNSNLITFSILGKNLYKEFGYVYHPDYKSLYCDNEFTEEVMRMNKVKYINKVIIKHNHYSIAGNENSGDYDVAAKKTLYFSGRDKMVYEFRKQRGFPKERITVD